MVRFARSVGSKGSNKRVLEEPTPWSDMVAQMKVRRLGNSENERNNTKFNESEVVDNEKKDNAENVTEDYESVQIATKIGTTVNPNNEKSPLKKKKRKKNKNEDGDKSKKSKMEVVDEPKFNESEVVDNEKKDNVENVTEDYESVQTETKIGTTVNPSNEKSPLKKKKRKKNKKEDGDKSKKSKMEVVDDPKFVVENNQKYQILENGKKRPWFDLPYEDSDRMTRYEGFWMKPEMVKKLDDLKETLKATMDSDTVRKKMMKAKRKAHKELTRELIYEQKRLMNADNCDVNEEENSKNDTSKKKELEEEVEGVLFNGYWVTKEGAARLKKLRADLVRKGVSKEKQRMVIKSERRKEEKGLRREKRRVCLRCRKRGHMVNDCPEIDGDYGYDKKICICYACGSTEHRVHECPQASKGEGYPHATCFICRQVGHISRQCPDNPRGLYPNGGSCRGCGSVVHLVANCPLFQMENEQATIKVGRIDRSAVESLDFDLPNASLCTEPSTFKKQSVKVVSF